jgi:hypothetical protein
VSEWETGIVQFGLCTAERCLDHRLIGRTGAVTTKNPAKKC